MNSPLLFDELVALTGGRLGKHEVACPQCGPQRHTAYNRRRTVLCIWHSEPGFVTYGCARCGIAGYAIDDGREPVSRVVLEKARREVEAFERDHAAKQLAKARRLWRSRRPIVGTVAEPYLREARGIPEALPGTLGFLCAR